ncbi:MAG TPA: T9SS type A sorting domain-containing protein, partial [Flavobacteriales bacterium]|nr:T9SS type A sorting domain-containing protein [Flavobacteriales bacterium]
AIDPAFLANGDVEHIAPENKCEVDYERKANTTAIQAVPNDAGDLVTNMVTVCFDGVQPYQLAFTLNSAVTLLPTGSNERIALMLELDPGLYILPNELVGNFPLRVELADGTDVLSTELGTAPDALITVGQECEALDCPVGNDPGWGQKQRLLLWLPSSVLPTSTDRIMTKLMQARIEFFVRMHCPMDADNDSCASSYVPGCTSSPPAGSIPEIASAQLRLSLAHFLNGAAPCTGSDICSAPNVVIACHEQNYNLQCPGCTRIGIHSQSFNMYRTSYGLVDQDDDGHADLVNGSVRRITTSEAKAGSGYGQGVLSTYMMFGDSLEGDLETFIELDCGIYGPCVNDTPVVDLKYLYYKMTVTKPADTACSRLLKPIGLDLIMYNDTDSTVVRIPESGLPLILSDTTNNVGETVYRYDLSPSVIASSLAQYIVMNEIGWDPSFSFNAHDAAKIQVRPRFKVECNIGPMFQTAYVGNEIYLGARPETVASPLVDTPGDFTEEGFCGSSPPGPCLDYQYWCTRKSGTFTVVGYVLRRKADYAKESPCANGPEIIYQLELGQNPTATVTGDNCFRNEYRNWFQLSSLSGGVELSEPSHWGAGTISVKEQVSGMSMRTITLFSGQGTTNGNMSSYMTVDSIPTWPGTEYGDTSQLAGKLFLPDDDFSLTACFHRETNMLTTQNNAYPPFPKHRHAFGDSIATPLNIHPDDLVGSPLICTSGLGGCSGAMFIQPVLRTTTAGDSSVQDGYRAKDCWLETIRPQPFSSGIASNNLVFVKVANPWVAFAEPPGVSSPAMDVKDVSWRLPGGSWADITADALEWYKYEIPVTDPMAGNTAVELKVCATYDCYGSDGMDMYLGWECDGVQSGEQLVQPPVAGSYSSVRRMTMLAQSRDLGVTNTSATPIAGGMEVVLDLKSVSQGTISNVTVGFANVQNGWQYESGSATLWRDDDPGPGTNWVQLNAMAIGDLVPGSCPPVSQDPGSPSADCWVWEIPVNTIPGMSSALCGALSGQCAESDSRLRVKAHFTTPTCDVNCLQLHAWAQAEGCNDPLLILDISPPTPLVSVLNLTTNSPILIGDPSQAETLSLTVNNPGTDPVDGMVLSVALPDCWTMSTPAPGWTVTPGQPDETWSYALPVLSPGQSPTFYLPLQVGSTCPSGAIQIQTWIHHATMGSCASCNDPLDEAQVVVTINDDHGCEITATASTTYSCAPPEDNDCAVLPIQEDEPLYEDSAERFPALTMSFNGITGDFIFENGWGIFNEYEPGKWQLIGELSETSEPDHLIWIGLFLLGPFTDPQDLPDVPMPIEVGGFGDPGTWTYYVLDDQAPNRILDIGTQPPSQYLITQSGTLGFQHGLGANTHNSHQGLFGWLHVNGQDVALSIELDCERDLPNAECSGTATIELTEPPGPVIVTLLDEQDQPQGTMQLMSPGSASFTDLCAGNYSMLIETTEEPICEQIIEDVVVGSATLFTFTVEYDPVVCVENGASATIVFPVNTPNLSELGITWYWSGPDGEPVQTSLHPDSDGNAFLNNIATDQEAWFVIHDPVTGCRRMHKIYVHAVDVGMLEFSVNELLPDCPAGSATGAAEVSGVVPAYGSTWSTVWIQNGEPIASGDQLNNVISGVYQVTVEDGAGCARSSTLNIGTCQGEGEVEVIEEVVHPACPGGKDGWIRLSVEPGQEFEVLWSDGGWEHERGELEAGVYSYTVHLTETDIYIEGSVELISAPFEVRIIWPGMHMIPEECIGPACAAITFGPWPEELPVEEIMELVAQGWPGYEQPGQYTRDELQVQWNDDQVGLCVDQVCGHPISVSVRDPLECVVIAEAGGNDRNKHVVRDVPVAMRLFPNPNRGDVVNVTFHGLDTEEHRCLLEVMDVHGRVVQRSMEIFQGRSVKSITLSTVSGVYNVRGILDGEIYTHQLIVTP